jgi:hypothetical protein
VKIHTFGDGQVVILESVQESMELNKILNEWLVGRKSRLATHLATETYNEDVS